MPADGDPEQHEEKRTEESRIVSGGQNPRRDQGAGHGGQSWRVGKGSKGDPATAFAGEDPLSQLLHRYDIESNAFPSIRKSSLPSPIVKTRGDWSADPSWTITTPTSGLRSTWSRAASGPSK